MSKLLRKLGIGGGIGALLGLVLSYPAVIALSHKAPAAIPKTLPKGIWADRQVGAAIELIETELRQRGWAAARSRFHPQSLLTAMPAQQAGLADTLSELATLRAGLLSNAPGAASDLQLAASLLKQANAQTAEDQLFAAIQALRRFDGLKARSVLEDRDTTDILANEVSLYIDLIEHSQSDLDGLIRSGERGFSDQTRTEVFFHVRGRIYTISALLKAASLDPPARAGFRSAYENCQSSLERAFDLAPVFVSNPAPGSLTIGGNDLVMQAYLLGQSLNHLKELKRLLTDKSDAEPLTIVDRS